MCRMHNFGCSWEPLARECRECNANVRRGSAVQSVRSKPHRDGRDDSGWDGSKTYHVRPLLRTGGKPRPSGSGEKLDTLACGSSLGTTIGTMPDIVLIDPSVLSRDSLDQMLTEQCHGMRTLSFETLNAAEMNNGRPCVVVLVQATHHEVDQALFSSQIASALSRFPDAPVLAVSEIDTPQACSQAFEAGASGFFPMSGEAQQLLAAVQLLVAGGHYVPGTILAQLFGSWRSGSLMYPSPMTGAAPLENMGPQP